MTGRLDFNQAFDEYCDASQARSQMCMANGILNFIESWRYKLKKNEDIHHSERSGDRGSVPDSAFRRENGHARHCFFLPSAFGLIAAVIVVSLAGLHATSFVAAALLSVAGLLAGRQMSATVRTLEREIALLKQPTRSRLEELCLRVFPVWSRQLDTSRATANGAVAQLSDLFGEIITELERALSASMSAVGGGRNEGADVLGAIDGSEAELRTLIDSLKALEQSRDAIRAQVKRYANDLKDMSSDVQQVAMRLRLVSLNAGIEAARAGEAGKPFAVVTSEMRQLAGQFADTSFKMSKQVEAVNSAIATIYRDSRHSAGSEFSEMAEAEEIVSNVIERFQSLATSLAGSVERLEQERVQIRDQVSAAIVALQFQDRVSQILSRVHAGLDDVARKIVDGDEDALDFHQWISEAKRSYTTSEEFANVGEAIDDSTTGPRETTYF
jgi:methyl-accepting chemotaxis protein